MTSSSGKRYSIVERGFGDIRRSRCAIVFTEFPPEPREWSHNGVTVLSALGSVTVRSISAWEVSSVKPSLRFELEYDAGRPLPSLIAVRKILPDGSRISPAIGVAGCPSELLSLSDGSTLTQVIVPVLTSPRANRPAHHRASHAGLAKAPGGVAYAGAGKAKSRRPKRLCTRACPLTAAIRNSQSFPRCCPSS